jgi:hypothetical protein
MTLVATGSPAKGDDRISDDRISDDLVNNDHISDDPISDDPISDDLISDLPLSVNPEPEISPATTTRPARGVYPPTHTRLKLRLIPRHAAPHPHTDVVITDVVITDKVITDVVITELLTPPHTCSRSARAQSSLRPACQHRRADKDLDDPISDDLISDDLISDDIRQGYSEEINLSARRHPAPQNTVITDTVITDIGITVFVIADIVHPAPPNRH